MLLAQAAVLQQRLKVADALAGQDAEVARLLGLADAALADGALKANVGFLERAAARQDEVDAALKSAETDLQARWLESGAVKARLGEGYMLDGDFARAAASYAGAFAAVERLDAQAAYDYKWRQAYALHQQGDRRATRRRSPMPSPPIATRWG